MTPESRNAIRALIQSAKELIKQADANHSACNDHGEADAYCTIPSKKFCNLVVAVESLPEMRETVEAVFTDVPPTKHGWYWCRTINISKGDCPCMIIDAGRGLYFAEWGRLHAVPLVEVKGKQFSGPITP